MRLLICGGRDFHDAEYAVTRFERLHRERPITGLICGMAKGGDTLGLEWAKARSIPVEEFWADWKLHGGAAGPIRNEEMLNRGKPDLVMGLPGGTGTAHMLNIAGAAGVEVIEYKKKLFSRARDPVWGWCSNFWPEEQTDQDGNVYRNNEHYYQIQKTVDPDTREWIAKAKDAAEAKRRGNDPSVTIRPDWDTYKLVAMMDGLRMKFKHGSKLAQTLLDTEDLYLVEYAPWGDSFWGINAEHQGQNWLGRLLMRRRDELLDMPA